MLGHTGIYMRNMPDIWSRCQLVLFCENGMGYS